MKKAKKLLALALAMSMTVGLAACSSGGTDTPSGEPTAPVGTETETPAAGGEGNKLIAGIVFQEDQFFKLLSAGYQAAADEYGYEIQMTNTNNDQTRETDALNTYLAQGVAGVAILPRRCGLLLRRQLLLLPPDRRGRRAVHPGELCR